MVTATDNPKVWKVGITAVHGSQSKSEIVCYLALTEAGVRIYYSHHLVYTRPVAAGPWSTPQAARHGINPHLEALIESSMAEALWEIARGGGAREILPFPGEMDRLNPSVKDLEL